MKARALVVVLFLLGTATTGWTWSQIDTVILSECRATGVPFAVAERLIQSESSWNPRAVNPSDPSIGIAQLQIRLLPWFSQMFNGGSPVNPWNPVVSARILVRYLAWLHKRTGGGASWYWAAVAYKAGPSHVMLWSTDVDQQVRAIAWWVATGGTEQ